MDRKKRSQQAALTNDEGHALHQSFDDLTFFIGHDHFDHPIDKKIGERESKTKIPFFIRLL